MVDFEDDAEAGADTDAVTDGDVDEDDVSDGDVDADTITDDDVDADTITDGDDGAGTVPEIDATGGSDGPVDARTAVELRGVSKQYAGAKAISDVSIAVAEGEFFTLVGPSGCGKTTTLRLLGGFEAPSAGAIYLDGDDVTGVPPEDRNVGIVFQNYALFPHMTVRENVAYGLKFTDPPGELTVAERVDELLALVDLQGMADREPDQLSGGQKQRVALVRALAPEPEVLLLDEPMSALDAELRERLRVELRELQQELGITTIYVTHDQEEALAISDRVGVMRAGSIEQIGTPRDIYYHPSTRFVAEFVGDNNVFSGTVTEISRADAATSGDGSTSGDLDDPSNGANLKDASTGADPDNTAYPESTILARIRLEDTIESKTSESETSDSDTFDSNTSHPDASHPDAPHSDDSNPAASESGNRQSGLHVSIAVDGTDTSENLTVGDRVVFCVRPEHFIFDHPENRLETVVRSSEFLGGSTRVHLDWNGQELLARSSKQLDGEVIIGFDPSAAHIVNVQS